MIDSMPIDPQVVSRKLKHARELQEIGIEVVSQATGIDSDRISLIESGVVKPSGDEVLILASYYRHDFRDFLDSSRPAPFDNTDILYRSHGDAFNPADRRAIQEFLYLCEIESALEIDLKIKKKRFEFTPQGDFYKAHGKAAASDLRAHLGFKTHEIPRDVYEDFRKLGFHVFRRRLDNRQISGLYLEHPIAGHCLLINYEEDIYRQRFSVCHEAAHAIFDSTEAVLVSFQRSSSNYNRNDLKEVRANNFASCYLIPPGQLPSIQNWTTALALDWAQKLRVSTSVLAIALREENAINDSTYELIRSVKVNSGEKIDPEAPDYLTELQRKRRLGLLERGLSDYYVGLCFEAYHKGLISAGWLSEALLADHAETREISTLFGRSIQHGN